MPLTKSTVATIDQRAKDDPDSAATVDAELQAVRIEQELVALRNASGLSQRQLAAKLGVKQAVIAKLEAGKSRNIGLQPSCVLSRRRTAGSTPSSRWEGLPEMPLRERAT
jgi:DNA-binding XRE family transcriptional regulator